MAQVVGSGVKLDNGTTVATPSQGAWYDGQQYWGGTLSTRGSENSLSGSATAGQKVSNEVVAQTANANVPFVNGLPAVQTATNKVQNAVATTYTPADSPKVSSLGDITAGIKDLLPTNAPTAPNLVNTYNDMKTAAGLDSLESTVADLTAQEDQVAAQLRVNTAAERGKPVAMNVIEGRMTEQQRTAQEELAYIGLRKQRAVDQLTSAYKNIQTIMDLTQKDYENAKGTYDSQFANTMSMITLARGIRADQVSEEQHAQDTARANAQIFVNAITSGNMNVSSADPAMQANLNKLELQSGLPVGFFSTLKMSPKDSILHINDTTGQVLMSDGNGGFKTVQAMKPSGTGNATAQKTENISVTSQILDKMKNSYGHVSPQQWQEVRSAYLQSGGTTDEFNKNFSAYTDPYRTDFAASYGFPPKDRGGVEIDPTTGLPK